MKHIKFVAVLIASVTLSGCADHADDVKASFVTPIQYENYSCKQIRREMIRVSQKVSEVSGVQDKHASNDAVATGVGVVIFWPALFFLASKDDHTELASLKGQYDALQQAAIEKDCDVVKEINAGKKMEEARKAKEAADAKASASQYNNSNH